MPFKIFEKVRCVITGDVGQVVFVQHETTGYEYVVTWKGKRIASREKHMSLEKVNTIMFKVGDRVKSTVSVGKYSAKGVHGTIVAINNEDAEIEFDEFIDGHDCGGTVKNGYGWIVFLKYLEVEDTTKSSGYKKCKHEYVDVGFMHIKMVCKYCNKEEK